MYEWANGRTTFPKACASDLADNSTLVHNISGIADPWPSDRLGRRSDRLDRRFREGLLAD
jgi:hypothetical protein